DPLARQAGPPIFVLTSEAADRILTAFGISATAILTGQLNGDTTATQGLSMARDLPLRAHLELPIAPVASSSHSLVALTPAPAGAHRLVIWAVAPSLASGSRSAADALGALVRALGGSHLRFATVYGDLVPAIDDYAARIGAAALRTAGALTADSAETGDLMSAAGLTAFADDHWVLLSGDG